MIVLARSFSAASSSAACASAPSAASSSMSNTFPWRTLAMPSMPSDLSAPSIALPCGSRMPDFSVTVTRAFIQNPEEVAEKQSNQAGVPIDIGQFQTHAKRQQVKPSLRARESPFSKPGLSLVHDHLDCILRNDDVMRQRRQRRVGVAFPAQIAVRGGG